MKRDKTWQRKHISDLTVVEAVDAYSKAHDGPCPYEAIAAALGCPEAVAYAACERAHERDLIDYGVSLRTGWLTDKGKELLRTGQ